MKYDTIQHRKTKLWHIAIHDGDDTRLAGDDGAGFEEKGSAEIAIEILYSEMLYIMHNAPPLLFNGKAPEDVFPSVHDAILKAMKNG